MSPEPAFIRSGLLLQLLEEIGVRRLPSVPPRKTVPHKPLIHHLVVQANLKVGPPVLVAPFRHRFDSPPKNQSPDGLTGLRAVRLSAFGGINAVELHSNDLPGLAEKMHGIAVQYSMNRSDK